MKTRKSPKHLGFLPHKMSMYAAGLLTAWALSCASVPLWGAEHTNLSGSDAVTDNDASATLNNTSDSVYQGAFSSGGTVTKTGSGTLTISGSGSLNSAGQVDISEGTLVFSGSSTFSSADTVTIKDGTVLKFVDRTPNNSGTLSMDIHSGGTLEFNMTSTGSYTANIPS